MKEILIKVEGMHCEGCENRVKNVLQDIEGVQKVIANYKEGTVKIELNKEIDIKILKEAIEDIGFDIV